MRRDGNRRLKRLVAELTLDQHIMPEVQLLAALSVTRVEVQLADGTAVRGACARDVTAVVRALLG